MTIQLVSVFLITLAFLSVFVLLWFNRKYFLDLYNNISRGEGAILVLIIVVFTLISIYKGYSLKTFIPADQEWELLRQGKDLALGKEIFNQLRYGLVYPILLSFGFILFGFSPLVASVMNFIFGVLSIVVVFALTQAVFRKVRISLVSCLFYAVTPLVFVFTNFLMGFPIMTSFFLLLFSLSAILFFEYHRAGLLALSLFLFAILSQIKPEFFVLIVPFGLCYFMFKEYKNIKLFKLLSILLVLLVFLIPYFVQNSRFKSGYSNGWCGSFSLVDNFNVHKYSIAKYIDPIIKTLINARFSINYLIYKVPGFLGFWTYKSFIYIIPIIFIGIIFGFKNHFRKILLLLLLFCSISFLYMADCFLIEARYYFPSYGLIVIFFGFGLKIISEITMLIVRKVKIHSDVILIFLSIFFLSILYFLEYKPYLFHEVVRDYSNGYINIQDEYVGLKLFFDDISKVNSFYFVPQQNEAHILSILGYEAMAIGDIEAFRYLYISQSTTPELPLKKTMSNYFLQSSHCDIHMDLKAGCELVLLKYKPDLIKSVNGYSLYLLDVK